MTAPLPDTDALLETFGLACWRCGQPGPDGFEDEAALRDLLVPRQLPGLAAMMIQPGLLLRAVRAEDLVPGKPVHGRCRPGRLGRMLRTIG